MEKKKEKMLPKKEKKKGRGRERNIVNNKRHHQYTLSASAPCEVIEGVETLLDISISST